MLMEADERMYNQAEGSAGIVPAVASDGPEDERTGTLTDPRAHRLALALYRHLVYGEPINHSDLK